MYGRATKAVSVCPPAYYADKAADRAHQRLAKYMEWERTEYKNKTDRRTPDEKKNAILDAIKIHQDLADTMFYV